MLQGINRLGKSWVGRVLVAVMFGFLIVSFAIWGIGDVFRSNVRTEVATVGGQEVSAEAFRNAYQTEYQNLIRRTRQSITPDQARALGLEGRVLSRLVSEAAFDQQTRALGLHVPDDLVVKSIQADPAFRGANGAFDVRTFRDLLQQNGLAEQQYVRDQRSVVARTQLADTITAEAKPPLAMREAVHRYRAERRSADYVVLTPASLGDMPAPTEPQLQTYYDEHKRDFRAPEYRSVKLLTIDAANLAKPDAVSDQDARAFYDKVKDTRYGSPERRTIQQVMFPTMEDATAASDRIKAGESFDDLASSRGVTGAALDLGTFSRGEMIDPATADAAFSLPEGGVSGPVAGRFGPVVLRVTKIEPGDVKPFAAVEGEVKGALALERARDEVGTVHDAIEDQRAGAKPLADIARDRGLKLVTIPAVDRAGQDKAGDTVALPSSDVLAAAFRSDVGADTEAVRLADGGYTWFEVDGVEPARDRPLPEVKDKVEDAWRKDEVAKALLDKARDWTARIDGGETLAAVAGDQPVKTASDLGRGTAKDGLGVPAVTRVFATPVGRAASVASDEGRVVFKVSGATLPPFVTSTAESAAVETQLKGLLADDLLAEYLSEIEKRIGVETYPANIRRAIGGEG